MMADQHYPITITADLVVQWEKETEDLQKRIDADTQKLRLLKQRLDALTLFAQDDQAETSGHVPEPKRVQSVFEGMSPPECIRFFLRSLQRSPQEPIALNTLREEIQRSGYPIKRFGKNLSYFYTILGRMTKSAEIVRQGEKIWYAGGGKSSR
jgi:hypothetical protein